MDKGMQLRSHKHGSEHISTFHAMRGQFGPEPQRSQYRSPPTLCATLPGLPAFAGQAKYRGFAQVRGDPFRGRGSDLSITFVGFRVSESCEAAGDSSELTRLRGKSSSPSCQPTTSRTHHSWRDCRMRLALLMRVLQSFCVRRICVAFGWGVLRFRAWGLVRCACGRRRRPNPGKHPKQLKQLKCLFACSASAKFAVSVLHASSASVALRIQHGSPTLAPKPEALNSEGV